MDKDRDYVALQKAIYQSIKTTKSSPSTGSASRSGAGAGASRAPRPNNLTTYGTTYRSNSSNTHRSASNATNKVTQSNRPIRPQNSFITARKNTLIREGIVPAERKIVSPKSSKSGSSSSQRPPQPKIGQETTGALGEVQWDIECDRAKRKKPEALKRRSSTSSITSTGSNDSLTSRGSSDDSDSSWHNRWIEKMGRGKLSSLCDSNGKRALCIESSSPALIFMAIYTSSVPSLDNAEISLRVHVHNGGSGQFMIILDYQEAKDNGRDDYVALSMNTQQKTWRLERFENGKINSIQQFDDDTLRPGKYMEIRLQIRKKNILSLYSNNYEVIQRWELKEPITGDIGIAVYQSKCLIRGWRVDVPCELSHDEKPIDFRSLPPNVDRVLAETIQKDIILTDLKVDWNDIAELGDAKKLLKEAAILPLILPEFFQGLRQPWRGVLLFGPPGTGKTMLAKAVASQAKTTFFNCSASTLVSKWHGESERLVKCLFQLARHYSPSTIFFDEIDALMMSRGSSSEHESSRRLKSELLSQIDGINSGESSGMVMVLATTNKPWDLDEAMRRRLEKRIYIPLPDRSTREEMFKLFLKSVEVEDDLSFKKLAEMSEGFSGADIHLICRDASMRPLRREISDKDPDEILEMKQKGQFNLLVTMTDFMEAFSHINPSVSSRELYRYQDWMREFGSI